MLVTFTKRSRILNKQGFWIHHSPEHASGSKDARALNMSELTGFWICLSMSDYVWLNMPGYVWICRYMREYAQICLNGFCFIFPYCNTLSTWSVLTYFNVYTKLEVLVLRKMMLFLVDTKIVFSIVAVILLLFVLNSIFLQYFEFAVTIRERGGGICESWYTLL